MKVIMHMVLSTLVVLVVSNIQLIQGSNFSIIPTPVVQVVDRIAKFYCQHQTAISVGWILNDVPFLQDPLPNVTHTIETSAVGDTETDGAVHVLTMVAHNQYNGTKVQCLASLGNKVIIAHPYASLTVQGPLQPVVSVHITSQSTHSITLSWTPPFSLNLTSSEPDIVYCVDTHNVITNTILASICNISWPEYNFTVDTAGPSYRDLFQFVVTARSNVEGARNGTSSDPIMGYFPIDPSTCVSLVGIEILHNKVQLLLKLPNWVKGVVLSVYLHCLDETACSTNCVCSFIDTYFNNTDGDYLTVSCSECFLIRNRKYKATVTCETVVGKENITNGTILSTHDLQNGTIIVDNDTVSIGCIFHNYTTLKTIGCFVTVIPLNPSLFQKVHYRTLYRNNNELFTSTTIINGLSAGYYTLYWNEIDSNNFNSPTRYSAFHKTSWLPSTAKSIENTTDTIILSANITTDEGGLCISCSVHSLGKGFFTIYHLLDVTNTITLYHVMTSRGALIPQYYCIKVSHGIYSVAVFGVGGKGTVKIESKPAKSNHVNVSESPQNLGASAEPTSCTHNIRYIILTTCSLTSTGFISLVFAMVVLVFCFQKKKIPSTCNCCQRRKAFADIQLQQCEAYEHVSIKPNTNS